MPFIFLIVANHFLLMSDMVLAPHFMRQLFKAMMMVHKGRLPTSLKQGLAWN